MFKSFEFCLPTKAISVPSGPDWLHEIKYDGYRLRLERDRERVRLISRGGYNWTDRYPWIVAVLVILVGAARAATPTVTPSPGHDARLQEERKAISTTSPSNQSAATVSPATKPRSHAKRSRTH